MSQIYMHKSRTQQSNALTRINGPHLKFIALKKISVVKSLKGYQNICSDNDQYDLVHGVSALIFDNALRFCKRIDSS